MRHRSSDHTRVREDGDCATPMSSGDRVDDRGDAIREDVHRLGGGDEVPALLVDHLHRQGVALGDPGTPQVPLPLTEMGLTQLGSTMASMPSRRRSGAAVCCVRWSVET